MGKKKQKRAPKKEQKADLIRNPLLIAGSALVVLAVVVALVLVLGQNRDNSLMGRDNYTANTGFFLSKNRFMKDMDTVVATCGSETLTNRELQVYYWMEVRLFLSDAEDNGTAAPSKEISLAKQTYDPATGMTWQQYFVREALATWQEYRLLRRQAESTGFVIPEAHQKELDNTESDLAEYARMKNYESVQSLLEYRFGPGGSLESYTVYLYDYYTARLYKESADRDWTAVTAELAEAYPLTVDYLHITLGDAVFTSVR